MKFKIEQSSEKINSAGGMALVGALLDKSGLDEAVDIIKTGKGSQFTVIHRLSGVTLAYYAREEHLLMILRSSKTMNFILNH